MYLSFQFGTFFIDHFRHTFGGIYRRSGFDDKQVTLLQIRDHGTGGRFHIGDVRPMVLLEWGRHYDKASAASGLHTARNFPLCTTSLTT